MFGRFLQFLTHIYLLRVPLLTAGSIFGFCFAAVLWPPSTKSLLGNAFDVDSFWGIFFVSLLAFLCSWVVMVTWRLIRLYGVERFFDAPPRVGSEVTWGTLLLFAAIGFSVVAMMIVKHVVIVTQLDEPDPIWPFMGRALAASLLGFAAALFILALIIGAQVIFARQTYVVPALNTSTVEPETDTGGDESVGEDAAQDFPDLFLPVRSWPLRGLLSYLSSINPEGWGATGIANLINWLLPENGGRGYVRRSGDNAVVSLLPGHGVAIVLFLVTVGFYIMIAWLGYSWLGSAHPVPTLCHLLLLTILLCWGFSGSAFFLDRYRIPVLAVPVVLLIVAVTTSAGPDYYYPVLEDGQADGSAQANAAQGPEVASDEVSPGESIIVVAASGGGIQAAAWTARVLTGLEEECQDTEGYGCRFGESVRLISAVSGGSVGTMHFVNGYAEDGHLPRDDKELDKIVHRAERSSLDQIAWGLLYPDLFRTLNPTPYAPSLLGLDLDRGWALEKVWSRDDTPGVISDGVSASLSEWEEDATKGLRPAVIFNTTVVETGERLPLASTELPPESKGRTTFERLFRKADKRTPDVRVVTAARLSAAYPYVSPAARARTSEESQAHLVDGGYYDNYGVSSLVEWLDQELTDHKDIKRVLVIEIRGADSAEDEDLKTKSGWGFQILAPPSTVRNVRSTGQRTHNDVELALLKEKWEYNDDHRVEIESAQFEFDDPNPPLSWQLTDADLEDIQQEWTDELRPNGKGCTPWEEVELFLTEPGRGCQ
jgi:hypothetical protein